jgi:hypothetical protein
MIYRRPGFLVYDLAPSPPLPPSPVSNLERRHTRRLRKRDNLLTEEGREGEEPNHTIARLSGPLYIIQYVLCAVCCANFAHAHVQYVQRTGICYVYKL